jgi:hypothetical protein
MLNMLHYFKQLLCFLFYNLFSNNLLMGLVKSYHILDRRLVCFENRDLNETYFWLMGMNRLGLEEGAEPEIVSLNHYHFHK